jgi:type VI secretion system secreted protein Hcp
LEVSPFQSEKSFAFFFSLAVPFRASPFEVIGALRNNDQFNPGGGNAMAARDVFLKLDGIPGESQDKQHKGEIEIKYFHFGGLQNGSSAHGGGAGAGKVHLKDFFFTMTTNKASPKLFLALTTGEHIPRGVLTVRKAGKHQQEFLKWTFTGVMVTSFHHSNVLEPVQGYGAVTDNPGLISGRTPEGADDIVPVDRITLSFSTIEMEYKEQKEDGTLAGSHKTGWDVKRNAKL